LLRGEALRSQPELYFLHQDLTEKLHIPSSASGVSMGLTLDNTALARFWARAGEQVAQTSEAYLLYNSESLFFRKRLPNCSSNPTPFGVLVPSGRRLRYARFIPSFSRC